MEQSNTLKILQSKDFPSTEYLPMSSDQLGRSMYLSMIFPLKTSVDFSGNSEISFSLRHTLYLFSGRLQLQKTTPRHVFLNY